MLFPYQYIEHPITELQRWIDYLFIHVWCNAKEEYSLDLLKGCSELQWVAEEEAWKEDPKKKAKDYITGPISNIYDIFKDELTAVQRKKIKKWYKRSKNIEKICDNKDLFNPITVNDLAKFSKILSNELYIFYKNLFESALDLAIIKNKNGTLEHHYREFIKINNEGICPFCGLDTLRSYEMEGHEAYDHYLPKENYPTYSINFKNLVPACHKCNSIHKLRNSPLYSKVKQKRMAFYPYSKKHLEIDLSIKVNISHYKEYEHKHISFEINKNKDSSKIKTWATLYNIEKRYKDELTNGGVGKYWLLKFMEELPAHAIDTELQRVADSLAKSKYKDKNFLKAPFLQACRVEGLF